jgi:hypothetical protein
MTRVCRASVALLLGVSLGALALTVIFSKRINQAAARDSAPTRAVGQSRATAWVPATEPTYFKVAFPPTAHTFTIMLTDSVKIQEARDIVSGVQTDTTSVMGTIIKVPAPYNPPWSYHLDPASIVFFDVAVDVCDASPQYVEEHLSEVGDAFLPGSTWCPMSSRVVEEVGLHRVFLPVVLEAGP